MADDRAFGAARILALVSTLICAAPPREAEAERDTAVYAEVLGKGGLWGVGFDYRLRRRIFVGAVVSTYHLEGEWVAAFCPYFGYHIIRSGHHAWFADVGPRLVHTWSDSDVPEWDGSSSTGVGNGLSTGYEYRGRLLARVYIEGVVGKGGALPWLGASVGFAF
jgi:hypothetical protein